MSRKARAGGDMDDVSTLTGGVFQVFVRNSDYVRFDVTDTPLRETKWAEAWEVMRAAGLSPAERAVFALYHRGLSVAEIAVFRNCKRSTVQVHLSRARVKCEGIEVGFLTALIEACGWSAVREYLADKREAKWLNR